jgi:Fe-S-cluster containining protein
MKTIDEAVEEWRQTTLKGLCEKCCICCGCNIFDLTEEQIKLIFNTLEAPKTIEGKPMFTKNNDSTYSTHYIRSHMCPALVNKKCSIYEHPLKPQVCRDFPIFIEEEEKIFTFHDKFCPATTRLYNLAPLALEAMSLGYKAVNMFGRIKELTMDDLKQYLK